MKTKPNYISIEDPRNRKCILNPKIQNLYYYLPENTAFVLLSTRKYSICITINPKPSIIQYYIIINLKIHFCIITEEHKQPKIPRAISDKTLLYPQLRSKIKTFPPKCLVKMKTSTCEVFVAGLHMLHK